MFVGPKQVLICSYPRSACGDDFVQGLHKTQSYRGVEVRQNLFPIWTQRRIGIAGDRMRQPGLHWECPTPPAAPNERGEKSMQGGRQLRRWQINTQVAVEILLCRETTTPPPRPKQTFSLPKLKIPKSPKLPTG